MTERLLEGFREDEAQLDERRDQRIRQRIAVLTRVDTDESGHWPFWDEPAPLELVPQDGASPRPEIPRRRLGLAPRVLAVAAGVLVIVLLGGAVVIRTSGRVGPDNEVGSQAVQAIIDLSGQRPELALGPGEYLHQRWEEATARGSGTSAQMTTMTVESWVDAEGAGRETLSDRVLVDPSTGEQTIITPATDRQFNVGGGGSLSNFSYDQLRSFPTDPADLLVAVASTSRATLDQRDVITDGLAQILMVDLTPPDVRAAAFAALDQLGAEAVGPRTDAAGRAGTGLLVRTDSGDRLLVVDPATSTVWELLAGQPGDGEPTVDTAASWRTMLGQEVTATVGRRRGGDGTAARQGAILLSIARWTETGRAPVPGGSLCACSLPSPRL